MKFDAKVIALGVSAWLKGMKYGVILFLFSLCMSAGWPGVFNLPETTWAWWNTENLVYYLVGGAALGWVTAEPASGQEHGRRGLSGKSLLRPGDRGWSRYYAAGRTFALRRNRLVGSYWFLTLTRRS